MRYIRWPTDLDELLTVCPNIEINGQEHFDAIPTYAIAYARQGYETAPTEDDGRTLVIGGRDSAYGPDDIKLTSTECRAVNNTIIDERNERMHS